MFKTLNQAHFQVPSKNFTFYSMFGVYYLDSYYFQFHIAFNFVCYCVYFILTRPFVFMIPS